MPIFWEDYRKYTKKQRKLSDDQVRLIRKLREAGETYVNIASQVGTNHQTVSEIIKGRRYRDVD